MKPPMKRPTVPALLRQALEEGQPVRIIFTHAGDLIVEPCALTDAPAAPEVSADDDTIITAFERRINHAQRRA